MELYVDGCMRSQVGEPDETLDQTLEPLRQENSETDRVIVELVCDGIEVIGDDLLTTLAGKASQFERIDVRTSTPHALVADALHDALEAYDAASHEQAAVVELFGQGKSADAIRLLATCLDRWRQINDAIAKSISLLGAKVTALRERADMLVRKLDPVKLHLSQIKDSLVSKDFVPLSHILQYEFQSSSRCWQDVIKEILPYTDDPRADRSSP